MLKKIGLVVLFLAFYCSRVSAQGGDQAGNTKIAKWQNDKKAAVSLTYDDNTINQFRVALPIMDKYGFKGTFYVITGSVPGSKNHPKFIGRPVDEIIAETANIPTNKDNFFERASAVRFLGYANTYQYHLKAGGLYENGQIQKAYKVIDTAYAKVRHGDFKPSTDSAEVAKALYNVLYVDPGTDLITWDKLGKYQKEGNEFGSHSISHPYLAVLDSVNLRYELEKSKEEIRDRLGRKATFSAECPFGTEDPRVMRFAHRLYPSLRNRMPRPYLTELDRASDDSPLTSNKEYVQWQRGPLSDTPMSLMKSWVDTSLKSDNIWLTIVIHGVEGVGWEPLSKEELNDYFGYIKDHEKNLWVATFKNVTKYMRERMNGNVKTKMQGNQMTVSVTHSLKDDRYNLPLTLKTYLPAGWDKARIKQGSQILEGTVKEDAQGRYIQYQAVPNQSDVVLSKI